MPFAQSVDALVEAFAGVKGAAFTDLDGEDIALCPKAAREELRLCAAYGGIALRRLTSSAATVGRAPVDFIVIRGTGGAVLALRVGDDYQLVVDAGPNTPTGEVLFHARNTVALLEANI